ncbi:helix-turn-helix transcriptional regulator [Lachnospiraceae bacterium MD329]|nr:helix-turn-helix transcriptional regulator [Lachnospiraceae bacterium MD329]
MSYYIILYRRVMIVPERKILADNLIKYRRENHLSQYEMAMECGISKETLSLIERESINPTLETMQKCAAYIGEPVAKLLSNLKNMQMEDENMYFPYCSIKHKANNNYSSTYDTYGIGLLSEQKSELLEFLDFVADICINYTDIVCLINLLNYFDVSVIHFRDIIEDYMVDIEYYKSIYKKYAAPKYTG